MPFLARWPGQVKAGVVQDGMILNVDFAATILEAAGLPDLSGSQGRSFLPLLRGKTPADWRRAMYYRYYYSHFKTEPHYGVRTYDHKLIHFDRIDQWELYDLEKDPKEMNNLYHDPAYEEKIRELKTELTLLREELEDDPADDGSRPDIGALAPQPIFTATDIEIGPTDHSLLFRFRTDHGGTLFSKCSINEVPYSQNFSPEGFKTLCIRNGDLYFFNGFDDDTAHHIEAQLADDQWHTVALITRSGSPELYLDGELRFSSTEKMKADNSKHSFNIGAGIDTGGYRGYNFQGKIESAHFYERALSEAEVGHFTTGQVPDGNRRLIGS